MSRATGSEVLKNHVCFGKGSRVWSSVQNEIVFEGALQFIISFGVSPKEEIRRYIRAAAMFLCIGYHSIGSKFTSPL
jgi:hypothetical protein